MTERAADPTPEAMAAARRACGAGGMQITTTDFIVAIALALDCFAAERVEAEAPKCEVCGQPLWDEAEMQKLDATDAQPPAPQPPPFAEGAQFVAETGAPTKRCADTTAGAASSISSTPPQPGDAERLAQLINRIKVWQRQVFISDYELGVLEGVQAALATSQVKLDMRDQAIADLVAESASRLVRGSKFEAELAASRAEVARLTRDRDDWRKCFAEVYNAWLRDETARLRSPAAPGEDRKAARKAAQQFTEWVLADSGIDFWRECDAETVLENTIFAERTTAHAQGERDERERNKEIRHAATAFLAITETAWFNETITKDNIAWGLRHNLRRALAAPEPQEPPDDGGRG